MEEDISIVIRRSKRSRETKLDLSNRDLISIPNALFNLTNLQELDLSNNSLSTLSESINKLTNLRVLDLSNNQLSALPSQLQQLQQLNTLYLMGNPLFGKFQQLLKQQNCKSPQLQVILEECFQNDDFDEQFDDFELNDDDFDFGDTPSPKKPISQAKSNKLNKLLGSQKNVDQMVDYGQQSKQHKQEEEEEEEDLIWMNSFVQDEEPQHGQKQTYRNQLYNDNSGSDKQTIKRQKAKIKELEKELMKLKSGDSKQLLNSQGSLGNNLDHQILEINHDELQFGKKISQGGFSIVYKGQFRGTTVAIKKIFNPNITKELMAEFNNEISILNQHRHPNFVMIMAIVNKPPNLCIVTDFASNGCLFDLIHKQKKQFQKEQLLRFSKETARAILYLHSANIVHRDIKTLNVLLDRRNTVKLCDFGLARHISILNKGSGTYVGTPNYMAPEIYNQRQLTEKIDVFAFGTMLWEIFARQVPYDGLDPQDIMKKLQSGESLPDQNVSIKVMNLINKCRVVKPEKRPGFKQIYSYLKKLNIKDLY